EVVQNEEAQFRSCMQYFKDVFEAIDSQDFSKADKSLNKFLGVQREAAGDMAPSPFKVKLEVRYNKMNIFKYSEYSYALLGLIRLVIYFIRILGRFDGSDSEGLRMVRKTFSAMVGIIFIYHGAGLGMRWYISGHAPWSNGYEALVFIAWMTVIAGFLFSKKNPVILAGTCILAFFMRFVTEMYILYLQISVLVLFLK